MTDGMTEETLDSVPAPYDITLIRLAIEDVTDTEFVQKWVDSGLWCTPLYYPDALLRWPKKHAAVLTAIALARSGGVLFHCRRGHDRTGIIALLLLALVGVNPDEIVDDYEMSFDPERDQLLKANNTSTREVILNTIKELDPEDYLIKGGISLPNIQDIKERVLEPTGVVIL